MTVIEQKHYSQILQTQLDYRNPPNEPLEGWWGLNEPELEFDPNHLPKGYPSKVTGHDVPSQDSEHNLVKPFHT
jgi:hypothetical protein